MEEGSNNEMSFWQELKRRKVIRVIIGYAAASFVVLELTSMVTEPFGLPEWTFRLVFLVLAIGLVVTAVLSWIYDLTPRGIHKTGSLKDETGSDQAPPSGKYWVNPSNIIIGILLVAVAVLIYPKIFRTKTVQKLRSEGEITIAVMPFQNLTGDSGKNFWRIMFQDNLITSLSNSEALKVRQAETTIQLLEDQELSNQNPLTTSMAGEISRKLDARVFVMGNINQVVKTIRLNVKLMDSETREVFKAFQLEGPAESVLFISDSLSDMVRDYLLISVLKKNVDPDIHRYLGSASSPESMKYYINGMDAFFEYDYDFAISLFRQAVEVDSGFVAPMTSLAFAYGNTGRYQEAKKWSRRAYQEKELLSRMDQLMVERSYAAFWGTPYDMIRVLKKTIELDDQKAAAYFQLGMEYSELNQFKEAIIYFEKSLDIYDQWEIKPMWSLNYTHLGMAYLELGEYGKADRICREAEKDFPGDRSLIRFEVILALSQERRSEADMLLQQYETLLREDSFEEGNVLYRIANVYRRAGKYEKAEQYYRESLALDLDNTRFMNALANVLMEKNEQPEEAMELINTALIMEPDNYRLLATKGRLLRIQQHNREALEYLEKSWELKPVYDHELYLDLLELRDNALRS